jgi:hypothetical protein
MSLPLAAAVLLLAAILGDQCNYQIGRYFGPRVFQWENSRFFNRRPLQAHAFYERYGGVTMILARFMPFIRTFAPFVAGVADMTRRRFTLFNVVGALLWVVGCAGWLLLRQPALGAPAFRENHLGADSAAGPDGPVGRLARPRQVGRGPGLRTPSRGGPDRAAGDRANPCRGRPRQLSGGPC